ncbi:hypothetical protein [Borreliella burgdorferi]
MTKRLRNKYRPHWSRKIDSNLLAKKALDQTKNALNQLELSSIRIVVKQR